MSWIQTYTGRTVDVFHPQDKDFSLVDIEYALSNLCRYAGHCSAFYSVAQHSVHVAQCAGEIAVRELGPSTEDLVKLVELAALLHDASEAYLVDVPHPIKVHPSFAFYRDVEASVQSAIYRAFKINPEWVDEINFVIKKADVMVLAKEASFLMTDTSDWNLPEPPWQGEIVPKLPKQAQKLFSAKFKELDDWRKRVRT